MHTYLYNSIMPWFIYFLPKQSEICEVGVADALSDIYQSTDLELVNQ